ncbi:MAG: NIPSNAP family protein [Actinobacteria bacterium]|nr:NIPSNAP family protein [Actinomycetota bacterium]
MLYELRVYEILPGRMGAMTARLGKAIEVFRKHGFDVAGVWTETVGRNDRLVYITVFQDMGDRETKWSAFVGDPEWHKIRVESERDGPIVARVINSFMTPTSYSPLG